MQNVTSRKTTSMPKLNPLNERIKRDYARHLKAAQGKSAATVDAALKAIARFEDDTGARDFKTFRREQAIAFKDRLASTNGSRSGEVLSASTQASTLAALKDFFRWLAWQPGFKSRIHVPDIEYLNPSNKDAAVAKAVKLRDFPSLDQVRAAIALMPIHTVVGRRNRALMALAILTGIRDRALVSLSLRHIDMSKAPPLVRQEPDRVETKFAKISRPTSFPSATISVRSSPNGSTNCKRACYSARTIRCSRARKSPRTATGRFASSASSLSIGRMRHLCAQSTRRLSFGPVCRISRRIPSAIPSAT
jgi:integrase